MSDRGAALLDVRKSAVLSDCGTYRYELVRRWGPEPLVTWVMLNPSTADADVDDPTIRRCMSFAREWRWGGIRVVNLFALRATDPKEIKRHHSPLGDKNAGYIVEAIRGHDTAFAVAAWGAGNPYPACSSVRWVRDAAKVRPTPLRCLGRTRKGHPRHPLYVRGDQPLEVFDV